MTARGGRRSVSIPPWRPLAKIRRSLALVLIPLAAPALADLLGGQVQVIFGTMPGTIEYIRSGRLRPLAVTAATRSEALPDIPTIGDFVPGAESVFWAGVGVPKKAPTEIVEKLNREINAALVNPKLKARLADLGAEPMSMTPVQFAKFVVDETEKWAKVVKFSGAKVN